MIKKIFGAFTAFLLLGTMPCGAYAEETTETEAVTEQAAESQKEYSNFEEYIQFIQNENNEYIKKHPESDPKYDVNNDGSINVRDCTVIARAVVYKSTDTLSEKADINGDGVINVRDAAKLADILSFLKHNETMSYTQDCLSELKISGGQATCSSVIRGYSGKTTRIIINQTLQKKSGSRWVTVKAWSSTVRGYFGSVKKKKSGLSRGYYRLKTTGIIYSGKKSESVTKCSDEKRYI